MIFSPSSYSTALIDLPMDLIESELNRLSRQVYAFKNAMAMALLRTELNRRSKLMKELNGRTN